MLSAAALLLFITVTACASAAVYPLPESQETFVYSAAPHPFDARSVSRAKPVGIGALAEGGDTFNLQISIGTFANPVDIYITMLSPDNLQGQGLALSQDNRFEPFSQGMKPWRSRVTSAAEAIMDMPASSMTPGPYILMLAVMPSGVMDRYYLWTVPFLVQ